MKYKRFNFVGTFGDLSSTSNVTNSEKVLTTVVNGIINLNNGWVLDTTRCSSTTDYFYVDLWNNTGAADPSKFPSLLLKNTISNCKLFIGLLGVRTNYCGIALNKPHVVDYIGAGNYPIHGGFVMSMIPGESSENFGQTFGDDFIPPTATKVIGTVPYMSQTLSYVRSNKSNYNYTYCVLCDPYCVIIGGGFSTTYTTTSNIKFGSCCGRIFKTLAHEENTVQARYGCFNFTDAYNAENCEFYKYFTSTIPSFSGNIDVFSNATLSINQYGNTDANYTISNKFMMMFFACDGTPRFNTQNSLIRIMPACFEMFTPILTNEGLSGQLRWCPFEVIIASPDLQTYGVISGDGLKGYLDTDLIRCANNQYGRLYDNGEWIGVGSGILLKWDKDNTEML